MIQFVDNPDWARSLGQKGLEKVSKEFTNEVYAGRVYDVLCEVVGITKNNRSEEATTHMLSGE